MANLHEGEIILTKSAANAYRDLGGSKNSVPTNNYNKTVSNAPNININVYGGPKDSPMDIAQNVRAEVENIFRDLRLQRA